MWKTRVIASKIGEIFGLSSGHIFDVLFLENHVSKDDFYEKFFGFLETKLPKLEPKLVA
jgi:hypothetical protein